MTSVAAFGVPPARAITRASPTGRRTKPSVARRRCGKVTTGGALGSVTPDITTMSVSWSSTNKRDWFGKWLKDTAGNKSTF